MNSYRIVGIDRATAEFDVPLCDGTPVVFGRHGTKREGDVRGDVGGSVRGDGDVDGGGYVGGSVRGDGDVDGGGYVGGSVRGDSGGNGDGGDRNDLITIDRDRESVILLRDRLVSSRHARIIIRDDACWIEDLDSAHGTRVGLSGLMIRGATRQLDVFEALQIGASRFAVVPKRWCRISVADLVVECAPVAACNLASARAAPRLAGTCIVRNWGRQSSHPLKLQLSIPRFAATNEIELDGVAPGEHVHISPAFDVDVEAASTIMSTEVRQLVVRVGSDKRVAAPAVAVHASDQWIIGNEYAHRVSIAGFVEPNSPRVKQVVEKACHGLPVGGSPEDAMRALFGYLHSDCDIAYRHEPPSRAVAGQIVRSAREVLSQGAGRKGQGTCLDLALLIAGCLEHMHHQPLVVVLAAGAHWHTLVGCWNSPFRRLQAVVHPTSRSLQNDVLLIDPTCITRDGRYRRAFDDAKQFARRQIGERDVVFGIDISAARLAGIAPLPIDSRPRFNANALSAIDQAELLAEDLGVQLSVSVLFDVLIAGDDGAAAGLFRGAGISIGELRISARQVAQSGIAVDGATTTYEEALRSGSAIAASNGSEVITEEHLLRALIRSGSAGLKKIFVDAGVSVETVRQSLEAGTVPGSTVLLSRPVITARRRAAELLRSRSLSVLQVPVALLAGLLDESESDYAAGSAEFSPGVLLDGPHAIDGIQVEGILPGDGTGGTEFDGLHGTDNTDELDTALDAIVLAAVSEAAADNSAVVEKRHLIRAIRSHDPEEIDRLLRERNVTSG